MATNGSDATNPETSQCTRTARGIGLEPQCGRMITSTSCTMSEVADMLVGGQRHANRM